MKKNRTQAEYAGGKRVRSKPRPFLFVYSALRGRNDCEQLADICSKELLNDTLRATIESTIIK